MSELRRGTAMLDRAPGHDQSERDREPAAAAEQAERSGSAAPDEAKAGLPLDVVPRDDVRAAALRNGIALGWLVKRTAQPGDASGPDPLAARIGEEIANRRQELGWSQQELALAIGCDRSAVSRWEMGLRLPSLLHLIALGRALGCGARALLPE